MTAEIVVLNKEAAVLAADSAITFFHEEGVKASTDGRKILPVSDTVAMMVYGNFRYMGVPWETVVHLYRGEADPDASPREHAEGLMRFLGRRTDLFPPELQVRYLEFQIYSHLRRMAEGVRGMGRMEAKAFLRSRLEDWRGKDFLPGFSEGDILSLGEMYAESIEGTAELAFQDVDLTPGGRAIARDAAREMIVRGPDREVSTFVTGMVFTGFGADDIFPSAHLLAAQGKVDDRMRWETLGEAVIDHDHPAALLPLAEGERALGLLQGMDPGLEARLEEALAGRLAGLHSALGDMMPSLRRRLGRMVTGTLEAIQEDLEEHMMEHHYGPLQDRVAIMGREEMARLAEEVVRIASFLCSMGATESTVRGRTDVVTISLADGLTWR